MKSERKKKSSWKIQTPCCWNMWPEPFITVPIWCHFFFHVKIQNIYISDHYIISGHGIDLTVGVHTLLTREDQVSVEDWWRVNDRQVIATSSRLSRDWWSDGWWRWRRWWCRACKTWRCELWRTTPSLHTVSGSLSGLRRWSSPWRRSCGPVKSPPSYLKANSRWALEVCLAGGVKLIYGSTLIITGIFLCQVVMLKLIEDIQLN